MISFNLLFVFKLSVLCAVGGWYFRRPLQQSVMSVWRYLQYGCWSLWRRWFTGLYGTLSGTPGIGLHSLPSSTSPSTVSCVTSATSPPSASWLLSWHSMSSLLSLPDPDVFSISLTDDFLEYLTTSTTPTNEITLWSDPLNLVTHVVAWIEDKPHASHDVSTVDMWTTLLHNHHQPDLLLCLWNSKLRKLTIAIASNYLTQPLDTIPLRYPQLTLRCPNADHGFEIV